MSKRTALTLALGLIASCAPAVAPSDGPTSSPAADRPTASTPVRANDVVTVRVGGTSNTLVALSVATGAVVREVPDGALLPDGRTVINAAESLRQTKLTAIDRLTGAELRSSTLTDRWILGRASGNGRWVALVSSAYTNGYTSMNGMWIMRDAFAVVDTAFATAPRIVQLEGSFFLDSISDDGRSLYLIANTPGDERVPVSSALRVYDLASATVADLRGDSLPQMNTFQTAPLRIGATEYRLVVFGQDAPYLVRIELDTRTARVVRLPAPPRVSPSLPGLLWSIVATGDGRTLYAANATAGVVHEIDVPSLTVRRTGAVSAAAPDGILAALARRLLPIAEAKVIVGRGALLSPDERTLYLIGQDRISAVDTRSLAGLPFEARGSFSYLASSSDGRSIYALNAGGRWMSVFDAETGAYVTQVDVGAFPRDIVAVEAR